MLKYHIQTVEVGSGGAASIGFSNIPQDYDDLLIEHSFRSDRNTATGDNMKLSINGQGFGTNITTRTLYGTGSVVGSFTAVVSAGGVASTVNATSNTFGNNSFYITNYTGSSEKAISLTGVSEHNGTEAYQYIGASLWNQTAAVTSIDFDPNDGSLLLQYSSASLYGIKRGADGVAMPVASGGTVTTSGGYTYHTFTSSSTFVANRSIQTEVLVVAGGGPGDGGGGGAGGYISSAEYVSSGSYSVIVGSGGVNSGTVGGGNDSGTNGSNSSVFSFSAVGGGAGGYNFPGRDGGSGGGGGNYLDLGGAGTAGQGNNGGAAANDISASGGGGGAGGAGSNAPSGSQGGNGGPGLQWINGNYYAGGGGGGAGTGELYGTGGIGGGGNGASGSASNGTANTGGGGGGIYQSYPAGNGGSGVVIIRYLTPAS